MLSQEADKRTREIATRQRLNSLTLYTETGDGSCPLACTYCFIAKQGDRQRMSLDTLHRAIDFLREYGTGRRLHFFGTEPLKRWDLIVAAAEYAPDIRITMTTNGYLMTEDKIQWLKDHPNARVVIWSLDGDEHHNRHRITRAGKSSHPQVVRNLKRYAEVIGLEQVALRGTITPDDMDLVGRLRFLASLNPGGVEIVPDVSADWDEAAVAEMYLRLGEAWGWATPPSGLLQRVLRGVQEYKQRPPGNGCGTGYYAWSVSPDGSLSLCHGWEEHPHLRFGSIWEGVTTLEPFEQVSWLVDEFHQAGNPYPKPECQGCHAYNHCMGIGWCAVQFYQAGGDPVVPTHGYCSHLRGLITAMEHWAAQQKQEELENGILAILEGVDQGWVTIDSESGEDQAPASS